MNKKALSAFLAMSTIAGVATPAVGAFAEEKHSVEELIASAKGNKTLFHYNQAYAAIEADKENPEYTNRLAELAPVVEQIKGAKEMFKAIDEMVAIQTSKSLEAYAAIEAKIPTMNIDGVDKQYLAVELVKYTRPVIWDQQSDMTKVLDKVNDASKALEAGKVEDARKAIDEAKTILADEKNNIEKVNEDYLNKDSVTPVEVKVADAEEKAPLKVQSVKAINASEIVVTFNKEVDENAANKNNYQLKVNNKTVDFEENVKVSGKTATLRLENKTFQSGDRYVIQTNDAIKSKDGKKAEKFISEEMIFNESAAPKLQEVKLDGDLLHLNFDRPVKETVTLIKIDGKAINSKDLDAVNPKNAGDYEYTVDLSKENADHVKLFKEIGTHEVIIYDVKDTAAAYPKVASVLSEEYTNTTKEINAPKVTGIKAVNANRFFISTNQVVELDKAKLVVEKGNHEFKLMNEGFSDTKNLVSSQVYATKGTDEQGKPGIWVVVTDAEGGDQNPLYKNDETSVDLKVTLENYTANGFIGEKFEKNVSLTKNDTKPVVVSKVIDKENNKLTIDFAGILDNKPEAKDIVVRDKDGVIKTIKDNDIEVNGEKITIHLDKVDAAPYTVEFRADIFKYKENKESISDYIANTLKNDKLVVSVDLKEEEKDDSNFKYTEFKFDDKAVSNDVTNAGNYKVEGNKITFKYPVDMSKTALDTSNYTLDGKALPKGTVVDFINDKQTVCITLPEGTFKETTDYKFGISTDVTTAAGSHIVSSLQTKTAVEKVISVKDNVEPELESAQYLVGVEKVGQTTTSDKIEVKFNEDIKVDESTINNDFKVVVSGAEIKVTSVKKVDSENKVVITLGQDINVSQEATISIIPEADQKGDYKEIAIKDTEGNAANTKVSVKANKTKFDSKIAAEAAKKAEAIKEAEKDLKDAKALQEKATKDLDEANKGKKAADKELEDANNLDGTHLEKPEKVADATKKVKDAEDAITKAEADKIAADKAVEAADAKLKELQGTTK